MKNQVHPAPDMARTQSFKQDALTSHMRADADHDGLVSKEELESFNDEDAEWLRGNLAQFDLNSDGNIDAEEWEAA